MGKKVYIAGIFAYLSISMILQGFDLPTLTTPERVSVYNKSSWNIQAKLELWEWGGYMCAFCSSDKKDSRPVRTINWVTLNPGKGKTFGFKGQIPNNFVQVLTVQSTQVGTSTQLTKPLTFVSPGGTINIIRDPNNPSNICKADSVNPNICEISSIEAEVF